MAFDYTQYDYDALVAEVTRIVALQGEWADTNQSSTGQVLIQVVSALTDNLHYMLERRTQESFIPTAKLITSIGAIANLIGYRPTRTISANGTLSIVLTDSGGTPILNVETITIPKHTNVTQNGVSFVTKEENVWLNTQTYPVTFDIIEGTKTSIVVDPSDTGGTLFNNNYVLITDWQDIENTSFVITTPTQTFADVRVKVGDTPAIEAIAFANATDEVYDVRITNRGLQIVFGDGVTGEKPTGNVTIEWVKSTGTAVEVPDTNLAFAFDSAIIQDEDAPANDYFYTLVNTTPIDDAKTYEDIETTRSKAPDFTKTSLRAITNDDYDFWTKESAIGGIVDAKTFGETEKGITVSEANNIYITYLTNDGTVLLASELQALKDFLDVYKATTTHLVIANAEVIPLDVDIKIKRNASLSASDSEVYTAIRDLMIVKLKLLSGSLGKTVYHSDIVESLFNQTITKNSIPIKVSDYVTVDLKAMKDFQVPFAQTTDTVATIVYGVDTDVYTININGIAYSYTSQGGDTASDVARILAERINFDTDVNASDSTNVITITLDPGNRNNQILYSEEMDNAVWTKTFSSVVADTVASPNGLTLADELIEDGTANEHQLEFGGLNAGEKVFAIRFKKNTRDEIELYFENGTDGERAATVFNGTSGAVISGPGTITALEDNWFECKITDNTSTVADTVKIALRNVTRSYAGDGTSGAYLWGAQLEYASDIGSYAKTTSTTLALLAAGGPYTVSGTGTTTPANLGINQTITMPNKLIDNPNSLQLFLPSSVELIEKVTMKGNPTVTFADANPDTIVRSAGSWVADGFIVGMKIFVTGSVSNDLVAGYEIDTVDATTITLIAADALTAEVTTPNVDITGEGNITVIDTDDGLGAINSGTVSYITGDVIFALLADGKYILRYSQDVDDNFTANEQQSFSYSLPKTLNSDVVEALSTINLTS